MFRLRHRLRFRFRWPIFQLTSENKTFTQNFDPELEEQEGGGLGWAGVADHTWSTLMKYKGLFKDPFLRAVLVTDLKVK